MGQLADVTRRFVAAFNENRPEDIDDLVDANYIDHHVPAEIPRGPEGIRVWFSILHSAFDGRIDIDDIFESADKVASRWRFAGTISVSSTGSRRRGDHSRANS